MGLVGLDTEVMKLNLCLRPGQDRGSLEDGRLAVLVDEVQHLVTRRGDDRGEDRVDGRARRQADAASDAEDRIQHCADRVRQRTPVDHRDRRADRTVPAEETGSIGLVLDEPALVFFDGRDVRRPDWVFDAGSRPTGRQQCTEARNELGLHEQILERRVSHVGCLGGEGDLGVRRQLDLSRAASRGWSA